LLLTAVLHSASAKPYFPIIRDESPGWISYKKNWEHDIYIITFWWKNTKAYCGYTVKNDECCFIPSQTASPELKSRVAKDFYTSYERLWQLQQKNKV